MLNICRYTCTVSCSYLVIHFNNPCTSTTVHLVDDKYHLHVKYINYVVRYCMCRLNNTFAVLLTFLKSLPSWVNGSLPRVRGFFSLWEELRKYSASIRVGRVGVSSRGVAISLPAVIGSVVCWFASHLSSVVGVSIMGVSVIGISIVGVATIGVSIVGVATLVPPLSSFVSTNY